MDSVWAVVPAAGSGQRFQGDRPKQYVPVAGAPILEHTLALLLAAEGIEGVVVALDASDRYLDTVPSLRSPRVHIVNGGAERADSVLAAIDYLAELEVPCTWVMVHDAARPCLPLASLQSFIAAGVGCPHGAIMARKIQDTIKAVDNSEHIERTVDRRALWAAQTPQLFPLTLLHDALRRCAAQKRVVTDEASAVEYLGLAVRVFEGPAVNFKITLSEDLALAEWVLTAQRRNQS